MNALETFNQAEINMSSKMRGLPFQTREEQQGIPKNLGTNLYMSPYVETVSCGENTPEDLTGTNKSSLFFIKTSKCEK